MTATSPTQPDSGDGGRAPKSAAAFRSIGILVPIVATGLFIAIVWSMPWWTQDDTFITLRYSLNLAEGNGPVFNPGERVEGYTNFLWMLILAGVNRLGGDPVSASGLLGIACGALLVWLTWRVGARVLGTRPALTPIAPILLAVFPGFAAESIQGLETSLFALLLIAGVARLPQEFENPSSFPWHALLLALSAMTRPEGVMVYCVALVCAGVHGRLGGKNPLPALVRSATVFCLVFGPYYVWRFVYYGHPFPNTFYAKTGGGLDQAARGLAYVGEFMSELFWIPLPLAILVVLILLSRKLPFCLIAVVSVAFLIYVALVGGDFKKTFRFIIPVLPFLALAFQAAWAALAELAARRSPGAGRWCVAAALLLTGLLSLGVYRGSDELKRTQTARADLPPDNGRARIVGRWLRENARPGDALAISTCGSIAYFSGIPVIDMLGLSDLHIARSKPESFGTGTPGHECGDGAYVLSRRPRFIIFRSKWIRSPKQVRRTLRKTPDMWVSERQILSSPEFYRNYRAEVIPVLDHYCVIYCRRE